MPTLAQESAAESLGLSALNRAPHARLKPGGVLALQAIVANSSNTSQQGIIVATVDGQSNRQNVRRVTVPPQSSSVFNIYLHVPESIEGKQLVEVKASLYVDQGGQEIAVTRGSQPQEYTLELGPDPQPTQVAFILRDRSGEAPDWLWPQPQFAMNYELALATRIDAEMNRRGANFDARPLPNTRLDWDAIETVILDDEAALRDAAFVRSLKEFLSGGGKLWIQLDDIQVSLLRPLLENDQICEAVEEVALNDFVVEVIGGENPIAEEDRRVVSYQPMRMKRVMQHGGQVTHRVDGWPAAIWMPVGYGQLLITTLEAKGWLQIRENPSPLEPFFAAYQSRIWANNLAIDINMPTLSQPLVGQVDYPQNLIGNPVVPKSWVVTALTSFCVLLALGGVWWLMTGNLSWLGILAPALGLFFSGVMLVAASYVRQDIPESVARLQLVQVSRDGTNARVREQSAVYLENSADMSLQSKLDGEAQADPQLASGIQRFEIDDFRKWSLSNQSWPAGLWRYAASYSLPTEDMFAQATLSEKGVQLTLPDLPSALQDPVLGFSKGDPMICEVTAENQLFVDGSLSAEGDRWISGALISSEQQRRLEVYQQFFEPDDRTQHLNRVLYGWTELWPNRPSWDKELAEVGSALVSLPVVLKRPEPGQSVFVPHGLVELRRDLDQASSTFAYSDTTGKWQKELTMAVTAHLKLILPEQVLPFQAESIEFELDIKAPQRDVSIQVATADGMVEVAQLSSPSIPWTGVVSDPRILAEAEDGVIPIALQVSERTDVAQGGSSSNVVAWQVDHLRASLRGAVAN